MLPSLSLGLVIIHCARLSSTSGISPWDSLYVLVLVQRGGNSVSGQTIPQQYKHPPTGPMSRTSVATASGSSSSFHATLCDALKRYRDKTKNDLVVHPLIANLQKCKLPTDIPVVLDKMYHIKEYIRSRGGDNTLEQWLNTTFTVIASFSDALGEGVGLVNLHKSCHQSSALKYLFFQVFPPAKVIFAGIGVLLIASIFVASCLLS